MESHGACACALLLARPEVSAHRGSELANLFPFDSFFFFFLDCGLHFPEVLVVLVNPEVFPDGLSGGGRGARGRDSDTTAFTLLLKRTVVRQGV